MKTRYFRGLLAALILIVLVSFIQFSSIQRFKANVQVKNASSGKATTMNAVLYYSADGKMVTLTEEPFKTLAVNTINGELTLYNFDQNSVIKDNNPVYSIQSNNIYYFLQNKKQDLGLTASGFKLTSTQFEDGLKITKWQAPMQLAQHIKEVELVHNKANPVFIAYIAPNGQYIKKTYFYQFADLMGVDFPAAITEITYLNEKDSLITKTSYSQFVFNESVETEYLQFKVPANAKVITNK